MNAKHDPEAIRSAWVGLLKSARELAAWAPKHQGAMDSIQPVRVPTKLLKELELSVHILDVELKGSPAPSGPLENQLTKR